MKKDRNMGTRGKRGKEGQEYGRKRKEWENVTEILAQRNERRKEWAQEKIEGQPGQVYTIAVVLYTVL